MYVLGSSLSPGAYCLFIGVCVVYYVFGVSPEDADRLQFTKRVEYRPIYTFMYMYNIHL